MIRPDDDIIEVKYFTALITGPKSIRQETYIDALMTLPKVSVILGKFKPKEIKCDVQGCLYGGKRVMVCPIEKRTDVNIASHIVSDAVMRVDVDNLILVSGDSDLVPAIQTARRVAPAKKTFVYVPVSATTLGKKIAAEIRQAAHQHRETPLVPLKSAQFAPIVVDSSGNQYHKPVEW